jgi:hypothetical protein
MKNFTKSGLLYALAVLAFLAPSCKKEAKVNSIANQPDQSTGKLKTQSLNYHLIGYWPLDGNGTDLSANGHNGTIVGAVTATADRFGNAGQAMHFSASAGSSSYLTIPDATDLQLWGNDFTINAWVRLDNYSPGDMSQIISKHNSSPYTGWGAAISGFNWGTAGLNQGYSLFGSGMAGTSLDESAHNIGTGATWHMLSYVYHTSVNTVDMYIDGHLDYSSHPSSEGFSTAPVTIGYNTVKNYGLNGDMDDIRLYNGALLAANITDLYNAPNNGGLLAYWSFDSNANDYSGHGFDGTATGTISIVDRNLNNAAFGFDGFTSFVSVADNTALRLNNTDFTLNAWVKLTSVGAAVQILAKRSSTPAGYGWSVTTTGTTFFGAGGGTTMSYGGTALTAGVWHMVTLTYKSTSASAGTVTHYVDGVASGTPVTGFPTPNSAVTNALVIGRDNLGANYYFNGGIDDVRIYNKLLSTTDITKLFSTHY